MSFIIVIVKVHIYGKRGPFSRDIDLFEDMRSCMLWANFDDDGYGFVYACFCAKNGCVLFPPSLNCSDVCRFVDSFSFFPPDMTNLFSYPGNFYSTGEEANESRDCLRAISALHVAVCQESPKDAEEITGVSSRRGSACRLTNLPRPLYIIPLIRGSLKPQ